MFVAYRDKPMTPRYVCRRDGKTYPGTPCPSVASRVVDELVGRQVLQVLQPAALELSLKAEEDFSREQKRLQDHWQQRLDRTHYQTCRAKRQYDAVEPENRLVARELERRWEQALLDEQAVKEDYAQFQQHRTDRLSASDREAIMSLAADIPVLWNAPSTTCADRQAIIRHLVERVVINIHGDSEVVDVGIHWAGGFVSQHEIVRPVGRYEQLRDYDRLIVRLAQLREAGHTGEEMADIVNAEGFRSPRGTHQYTGDILRKLLSRSGLAKRHTGIAPEDRQRDPNEWWIEDLVQHLKIPKPTLESWCRKGWILARKLTIAGRRWVIWADADEIQRLRRLRSYRRRAPSVPYPVELTTPKKRTE
jgi:hypothetical protein